MAAPAGATSTLARSNLTKQLESDASTGCQTPKANKTRSLSDAPPKPSLSPSPALREPRRISQDDSAAGADPITPRRRPSFHTRGLSLQMPSKKEPEGTPPSASRVPLSPQLDSSSIYGSPSSVLPRRSRGLDFARACTNLHHSTLAESSPDASPVTGRGISIPPKRGLANNGAVAESPSQNPIWSSMHGERTTLSSSVSSINMMDSEDSSDDSSDDMAMDRDLDDPMLNTPAASRINGLAATNSPGMEWLNNPQPTNSQTSLLTFQQHRLNFRKNRFRNPKSSHSSSSVSMRSSKPSPGALSPPIRPSVETTGYFGLTKQQVRSRRESLSLGTDDLHLSDSEWDATHAQNMDITTGTSSNDASSERGVIRRAVTRRSNLLPKTKGFARIRAALMEESDPLVSEARREAEVIKQVQESDSVYTTTDPTNILGISTTGEPVEESIESTTPQNLSDSTSQPVDPTEPFSNQAKRHSGGLGFWNTFEQTPPHSDRYRTPPPPSLVPQDSAASDDTMTSAMTYPSNDSPAGPALLANINTSNGGSLIRHLHRSRSTTPLASATHTTNGGAHHGTSTPLHLSRKRRRSNDFDPASFKRRAVSPGMMSSSAQSSPVVPQSPTLTNGDKNWMRAPAKAGQQERSNSGGSVSRDAASAAGAPKRVGLQGMTEANDGFMSMSID